jgi:hypothetical protein
MKMKPLSCILAILIFLSGCASSWYAKPEPAEEARDQISKCNYGLMGLADFSNKDFWIPGVAGHKRDHKRYDVTWHGISGLNDPYIRLAEPYMIEFNRMILESRKGQILDSYGRGPENKDYIPPGKVPKGNR